MLNSQTAVEHVFPQEQFLISNIYVHNISETDLNSFVSYGLVIFETSAKLEDL